jgi:chloride channel protein, CIC family
MVQKEISEPKPLNLFAFSMISILVGLIAGFGAVVFRHLIGLFHNLAFLGIFSFSYDANVHTPAGPWGPYIILVPVIGAVFVSFLITRFAPEAKGHGVPEVMEATFYNKGIIRPIVGVIKAVASALSIGTGGSVGREGPMVQVGSAFGSAVGQFLKLEPWQTETLIATGGAGGIAATFNTPLGGIMFAVELLMQDVSVRSLVPVVISTVTATYIGQYFFGTHPSFVIPAIEISFFKLKSPEHMLLYALLGIIAGLASTLFILAINRGELFFDRLIKKNYYLRHMLGMLIVGLIMYLLLVNYGQYYVEGVSYATIEDILRGANMSLGFLVLLFALKLMVTSITLGSGASGGILSPSFFLGATMGSLYGVILKHIFPGLGIDPQAFAVAGMAGMVGGATGASIMAVIMIFEMTLDYSVVIPMVITAFVAYGVRKKLSTESIYTMKLAWRGHHMPDAVRLDYTMLKLARDVMYTRVFTVPSDTRLKDFALTALENKDIDWYLVEEGGRVAGFVTKTHALQAVVPEGGETRLKDIMEKNYIVIGPAVRVLNVNRLMETSNAALALISEKKGSLAPGDVKGIISVGRVKWAIGEAVEIIEAE